MRHGTWHPTERSRSGIHFQVRHQKYSAKPSYGPMRQTGSRKGSSASTSAFYLLAKAVCLRHMHAACAAAALQ